MSKSHAKVFMARMLVKLRLFHRREKGITAEEDGTPVEEIFAWARRHPDRDVREMGQHVEGFYAVESCYRGVKLSLTALADQLATAAEDPCVESNDRADAARLARGIRKITSKTKNG